MHNSPSNNSSKKNPTKGIERKIVKALLLSLVDNMFNPKNPTKGIESIVSGMIDIALWFTIEPNKGN